MKPASGGGGAAWPRRTQAWLSEAVARIGSTLDLTQTAVELAEVVVPGFADGAVVYAAERLFAADEPTLRRAGPGAAVRRLVARLDGHPQQETDVLLRPGEVLVLGPSTYGSRVMETGQPVVSGRLDGETAERVSRAPGGQEIIVGYTSFLVMPLAARGAVVGYAAFGRAAASPAFSPADIALAGALASRAAMGIDNARLYHREQRAALALQRGLLPGQPDVPSGLEVAHRYLPVGDNVVGGDWYDIVPLSGGRAALIVGDAMGHGPEAAAVMVQLRTAAHTLADLELPPEQILGKLDKMAAGLTTAPFATCLYTVIDPAGRSVVAAQAGHLPPVLVSPGAVPRTLELPPGLPLGLGAESFAATEIGLPAGATLALYTDGLVESRTRPIGDGMDALCGALGRVLGQPDATLGDACEQVTQVMSGHGEDDITLVLARIRDAPGTR